MLPRMSNAHMSCTLEVPSWTVAHTHEYMTAASTLPQSHSDGVILHVQRGQVLELQVQRGWKCPCQADEIEDGGHDKSPPDTD